MIGDDVNWLGPDSWCTAGTSWSDAYQIKPMGILTALLLYCDCDTMSWTAL